MTFVEPGIDDYVFATGVEIETNGYLVRLTGWVPRNGGAATERQVVVQLTMSLKTARQLRAKLEKQWLGG